VNRSSVREWEWAVSEKAKLMYIAITTAQYNARKFAGINTPQS
jgi:hypothetical protein